MSVNKIYNIQEWQQITLAATPSALSSIIYPKTDGNWYFMNSNGVEKVMSTSYNLGNGLTSSTASGIYNFNLSLNIDGSTLTFSNTRLRVGFLTSSVFTQLGPATASFILSVNSTGTPIWVPYVSKGISGTSGYIPKFDSINSITVSNIYDGGTFISVFTSSNSFSGVYGSQLFVNGNIDAKTIYFDSNNTPNINIQSVSSSPNILQLTAPSFIFTDDSSNTLISGSGQSTTGNTLNLLNTIQITATASNNPTASVILSNVNLVGIGTASPTHLLTIFATQSALRLVDGSQGSGKYLVSDANGVASWQSFVLSGSVSILLASPSGLTANNFEYSILLAPNSGLTLSTNGLSINSSAAGSGLTFSNGSFSVVGNFNFNSGSGLTYSGSTYSVSLGINSGLTFSNNNIVLQIGSGLTLSNGTITSTGAIQNGDVNSLPYYNTTTTFTSSVISQVSNNILIGTQSNIGAKLFIVGSFSSTGDGIINNATIGRGVYATNLIFGSSSISSYITPGNFNIAIGDNVFSNAPQGSNNIGIGSNSLKSLTSGYSNVAVGSNAAKNITNANNSVAIGFNVSSNIGNESVAIGASAGYSGNQNIFIGFRSGETSNGSGNVFLGYQSGRTFTGSYSVFIGGYDLTSNTSNNIFISDGQGNLRIYSPSTGNILIGTMSDNGSKLLISGSVSIISATGNAFQLYDTTQGSGKILQSDANGYGSWKSFKYSATQSFTANTPSVINHNLNTMFYIIQLFDYTTGEEIIGTYTNRGMTQATITLTTNLSNCGVVILG